MFDNESLREATAARNAMREMMTMLEEIKPLVEQTQSCALKGEQPPNDVMAKVNRAIADATERAANTMPGGNEDPHMLNQIRIARKLADGYEANDQMAIAIAQAEAMGATYEMLRKMVGDVITMLDSMLEFMSDDSDLDIGLP